MASISLMTFEWSPLTLTDMRLHVSSSSWAGKPEHRCFALGGFSLVALEGKITLLTTAGWNSGAVKSCICAGFRFHPDRGKEGARPNICSEEQEQKQWHVSLFTEMTFVSSACRWCPFVCQLPQAWLRPALEFLLVCLNLPWLNVRITHFCTHTEDFN